MTEGFEDIAEVAVDPATGLVYELGWQSWSPSTVYPVTATSVRPARPEFQVFYRPERPAPRHGFQGEGLLAVQPSPGAPVEVFSAPDGRRSVPSIRALRDGDVLRVRADGPVEQASAPERFGLHQALSSWAAGYVERTGAGPIRSVPPIWASWYQYFTEFDQSALRRELDAMDRLELPVGIVRLDDAFQSEVGDWLESSGRFTSIASMVGMVTERGRAAGIWSAPFLAAERSRLAVEHPDWIVRDEHGDPVRGQFDEDWQQSTLALDVTHPAAADYLTHVFRTYRDYGVSYFMIDFLYAGALPGRRTEDVTPIEAYRRGMELIRDAIGPDSLLQGCGAPMLPSAGLVDTMRVGADIAPYYRARHDELANPGGEAATISTVGRAFLHGRFWSNDPDCFALRPEVERRRAWADVVRDSGAVRISSDALDALDDWGLATTRELLTSSRTAPFDTDLPLQIPAVADSLVGRNVPDRIGPRPTRGPSGSSQSGVS